MVKLGYIYETESDAIDDRDKLDGYYGCPNSAAEHWVSVNRWGGKWVIMYNDTLPPVIGTPVVLPEWTDPEPID